MDSLFGSDAPPPGDRFARVAVERALDRPRGSEDGLTYAFGDEPVAVGERVEVPLGRGNKPAPGVVVRVGGRELLEGMPAEKTKRITRRTGAALTPALVQLGLWMADYYVAPLGMVLSSMLPAAVKHSTGRVRRRLVERAEAGATEDMIEQSRLAPSVLRAWRQAQAIPAPDWPIEPRALARRVGARNAAPINRLIDAGLLRLVEKVDVRAPDPRWSRFDIEQAPQSEITPTPAQRRVIDGVADTLGDFAVHLLHGVTGSGKTEVYLRVIDAVIARGSTAIVLVPEISLTPQTAGRFIRRFGDRVAVLHSGLSASQRHRQWSLASSGRASVVVGARSAVFAPLANLGLIVVDEEHESGYKQDQVPRYHARDVAVKRGQLERCPVLLASATPSMESWWNAGHSPADGAARPRFTLWTLPDRLGGGTLPAVEVVDLAHERRHAGDRGAARSVPLIGSRLDRAVREALEDTGQVILLLNRRGYASYVGCPDPGCGWSLWCEHCDAAMVLHRVLDRVTRAPAGALVRCHHCLSEQLVPGACPLCGRRPFTLGTGTQQLEEELTRRYAPLLPDPSAIVRVDGDTMKSAQDWYRVLERFARGDTRILHGTQMIAKGLDFPNVRLVGVVNADTALAIPDFRAAERTFQLVSQVAGRTGRGRHPGRVIVQTMNPDEPAIVLASRHDYAGFAAGELRVRFASDLPPATRMARIVVRDVDLGSARDEAGRLAGALAEAAAAGEVDARVMGPMPCPISRIAGQFRFAVEVVARGAAGVHRLLATLRLRGLLLSDAKTAVDVDPIALM